MKQTGGERESKFAFKPQVGGEFLRLFSSTKATARERGRAWQQAPFLPSSLLDDRPEWENSVIKSTDINCCSEQATPSEQATE